MKTRYIPTNATEVKKDGINAVVYTYESETGIPYALAYSGRRMKPDFHYRYGSLEKRSEAIESYFKGIQSRANCKLETKQRQAKNRDEFLKKVAVGSLFYTNWGYEQTNVEWYQVTRLKGCTVSLREIAADVTETSSMSGTSKPIKGQFVGEELKRIIRGTTIRIDDVVSAFLSDGRPRHCSWYA
jgi:hypothetical protein